MKQTKQLINWAEMPEGVAVLCNTYTPAIFVCHALDKDCLFLQTEHIASPTMGYKTIRERPASDVRLAPADQQPWLLYEEGVTVIPEWAEVAFAQALRPMLTGKDYKHFTYKYRIGDFDGKLFKEGYTDDPNEVIK